MAGNLPLVFFLITLGIECYGYKLEQLLFLSRHNIRTPLTSSLKDFTLKQWPEWDQEVAFLTPKGALLESYLGDYFYEWMKKEELTSDDCPSKDSVYIYANTRQRTIESAKSFGKSAFKGCEITVNYRKDVKSDPVFYPVLDNTTEACMEIIAKEMQQKLDSLDLKESYLILNKILNIERSEICHKSSICDLTAAKDSIVIKRGDEPNVMGPLGIGNSVVDFFLMSYYNGVPLEQIGWGQIGPQDWKYLARITKENQNVRFNSTQLARHVARPLLNYITDTFLSGKPKYSFLFGHDSNFNSLIMLMGFKPYELPGQYEKTPVGGKLVFQKWYDEILDRKLMKIEFVYQTTEQLRNGTKLSLEDPPRNVTMELLNCKIDDEGFCLWNDFVKALKSVY